MNKRARVHVVTIAVGWIRGAENRSKVLCSVRENRCNNKSIWMLNTCAITASCPNSSVTREFSHAYHLCSLYVRRCYLKIHHSACDFCKLFFSFCPLPPIAATVLQVRRCIHVTHGPARRISIVVFIFSNNIHISRAKSVRS